MFLGVRLSAIRLKPTKEGKKMKAYSEKERINQSRNFNTVKNATFLFLCEFAGVVPTKRQASKYNNKKGAAFNARALYRTAM
jgi:hypothetical protein